MKYLDTSNLLKTWNIRPRKSLGQNFLVENAGLLKVLNAAELSREDRVLEIGAGVGSLTYLLAQTARQVTAVEIDKSLFPALESALEKFDNVRLVQGDVLEIPVEAFIPEGPFAVVANIPYYITSAILRHLLNGKVKPTRLVLTIQKEVAERILARDGKLSLLALSVHVFGEPEIAATIPAGSFYPSPDVDSAVLRIRLHDQPMIPLEQLDVFFKLAHAGFSQKRKQLRNSLAGGLAVTPTESEELLASAGIQAQRRAETLTIPEWGQLTARYIEVIGATSSPCAE